MKKIIFAFVVMMLFVIASPAALAEVGTTDKVLITEKVRGLEQAIARGDATMVTRMLSPNASMQLREAINENIANKRIEYRQEIRRMEQVAVNKIRVEGTFSAQGQNWNVSGLSSYLIFEKIDGDWYLLDSDFPSKLNVGFVFKIAGTIFAVVIPIFFLFSAFWVWMIIDVLRRDFKDKTLWLLVIIFTGIIGSTLYFFMIRRKLVHDPNSMIDESAKTGR